MSFFAPSFGFGVTVLTLPPATEEELGRPVGILAGFVEVFLVSWPGDRGLARRMSVSSKSEVSESVFITNGSVLIYNCGVSSAACSFGLDSSGKSSFTGEVGNFAWVPSTAFELLLCFSSVVLFSSELLSELMFTLWAKKRLFEGRLTVFRVTRTSPGEVSLTDFGFESVPGLGLCGCGETL